MLSILLPADIRTYLKFRYASLYYNFTLKKNIFIIILQILQKNHFLINKKSPKKGL